MLLTQKYPDMVSDQLRENLERITSFEDGNNASVRTPARKIYNPFSNPGVAFGSEFDIGHVIFHVRIEARGNQDHFGFEILESRQVPFHFPFVLIVTQPRKNRRVQCHAQSRPRTFAPRT